MKKLALEAAGSNLGVAHAEAAFPVGKIESLFLYPLNFEEFLIGINEHMAFDFLNNFRGEKTDDIYHIRLFELLKIYFITGGLPEFRCNSQESRMVLQKNTGLKMLFPVVTEVIRICQIPLTGL